VPAAQSEQLKELTDDETDPAGHAAHFVALAAQPAGHVHERELPEPEAVKPDAQMHAAGRPAPAPAVTLENAGQAKHDPLELKKLAAHAKHAVEPAAQDRLPTAQGVHDADPADAEKVPAAHFVHKAEFTVGEYDPALHAEQFAALAAEPAAHEHASESPRVPALSKLLAQVQEVGRATSEPALELLYCGHRTHAPMFALKKKFAEHALQDEDPAAKEVLPAGHGVHDVALAPENVPTGHKAHDGEYWLGE
jgi:hypothetical protein